MSYDTWTTDVLFLLYDTYMTGPVPLIANTIQCNPVLVSVIQCRTVPVIRCTIGTKPGGHDEYLACSTIAFLDMDSVKPWWVSKNMHE